jgi:membrane protein DedA with SNARE-associated domain
MSGLAAVSSNAHQAVGFPSLFVLVALGAIVPVIPTGALVSAAAVVAWHTGTPYDLPAVFVVASVAALVGDTALYWLASRGSARWLERLRARADLPRLETAQRRLDANGTVVLVVSRLIPAGRIPVMLACLFAGWSVRRFVRADIVAALAWSGGYLAVGVLGGVLFDEPWQGLVAVIGLAMLAAAAPNAWRWARTRSGRAPRPSDQEPVDHGRAEPGHADERPSARLRSSEQPAEEPRVG